MSQPTDPDDTPASAGGDLPSRGNEPTPSAGGDLPPGGEPSTPHDYPMGWISGRIDEDRKQISLLGEIREIVFGAQDGLVSTLAVVATVAGATNDQLAILIAGFASAIAGIFSMAVGEYLGSKSQVEIFGSWIDEERREVQTRPMESEAELAYLFIEEGMPELDAREAAGIIGRHPDSLLATMVSKELGLIHDEHDETSGSPLRGSLFMGASFALGGIVPIVPFLFGADLVALGWSTLATGAALFALGAAKSRWTQRSWFWSGLEILSLAAVAGVVGYLIGGVLPGMLGVVVP
jgi:vacuolar iron transporter family protein